MTETISPEPLDHTRVRQVLEARRRQLTGDLQQRVARIRDQGPDGLITRSPDDDDESDLDVSVLEIVAQTLRRVESALDRLDSGQYGQCACCARKIPATRLLAMPFALRCRDCETAREQAELSRSPQRSRLWQRDSAVTFAAGSL